MGEHELGRPRLGVAEGRRNRPLVDRDADVLQHVERRVERAVHLVRVVRMWQFQPPSANCALRIASASGEESRIVRVEEASTAPARSRGGRDPRA